MVNYESLPIKEEMKNHLKVAKHYGYYCEPDIFRSKKHTPYGREYHYYKGMKPHSHSMGRKPEWRKKRKEQRRYKNEESSARDRLLL
jgi:hypothetical protein